jgi:uncharacterized protein (TIGR03437 family)
MAAAPAGKILLSGAVLCVISASPLWGQIGNIVVTSAASFDLGIPPQGSIGTIFCTGLKVTATVSATRFPLPASLAGISVTIGGAPAPLFAVADGGAYQQINFQVPLEAQEIQSAFSVVVSQGDEQGSTIANLSTSPGEFFQIPGTSFGVFQHASDYSLVTTENPAVAGETIIGYATGLPTASPTVPDGQPAPTTPLSYPVPNPVFFGGDSFDILGVSVNSSTWLTFGKPPDYPYYGAVQFMGLMPGGVGLFQINFPVPAGLPSGNATIAVGRIWCEDAGLTICGTGPDRSWHVATGSAVLLPMH